MVTLPQSREDLRYRATEWTLRNVISSNDVKSVWRQKIVIFSRKMIFLVIANLNPAPWKLDQRETPQSQFWSSKHGRSSPHSRHGSPFSRSNKKRQIILIRIPILQLCKYFASRWKSPPLWCCRQSSSAWSGGRGCDQILFRNMELQALALAPGDRQVIKFLAP